MTSTATPSQAQPPNRLPSAPTVADVDASFRPIALFVLGKSIVWLILGSFLLLLASVKLHAPAMMSGAAWLTYGRLAPAGWDALVYGFVGQTGVALALWVLARSAIQRLQQPLLVLAGGCFWNLGVLFGVLGILTGGSTGREWLEMPAGAMGCLVMGAGLIGAAGWLTFAARTEAQTYPSAWFVLLALLSFVWFGTVGLMMLSGEGPRGVLQVLVQRWYANGMLRLWLGGITLALLFHALPLALQRPLASRQLSLIAFWCLAFFAPWAVTEHGDPLPRWIVSMGLAGQWLAGIALLAIAVNWWKTADGACRTLFSSVRGRLLGVAALAYVVGGLLDFVLSLRGFSSWTRFTWVNPGLEWLLVGGALMLGLFAVLPEFLARATGRSLPAGLVNLHGTLSLVGVLLTALPLLVGGLIQGARLANATVPFMDALKASMHLVRLSSLGLVVFLIAQVVLAAAFSAVCQNLFRELVMTVKSWSLPAANNRTAGVRS